MSATQDLIAAALSAAGAVRWQYPELSDELREMCARAMVQPVSEVPMPEAAAYLSDNGLWCNEPLSLRDEPAFFSGEMQQYGDARHQQGYAAGYMAGLAAAGEDADRYRWLSSAFQQRRSGWHLPAITITGAPSIETLDDAIDAALRMEVKP